jgi:pimeloyl-ACP methyl ester carboxylesterase
LRPVEGCPIVRCRLFFLAVVVLSLLPGCATVQPTVRSAMPLPDQGIVYVADGSGDLRQVSDSLATVLQQANAPLHIQRVCWTHGTGLILLDLYDAERQKAEGQKLAQEILAYRRANPGKRICLVGYSSGAGVALAAADSLPPCSLDRMILLAPSVSAKRDLRTALRASREGIDHFRSDWDVISLLLTPLGMADGFGLPVAGRTGFSPVIESPQDQQLYQGLRQYSWGGPQSWSGHDGGHWGCIHCDFLRAKVLPLLLGP